MFKELSLAECLKLEDLITPFESFQEFASATTTFTLFQITQLI